MTQVYRFVDSANGTVGGRHYDIRREDGATAWTCDTTGPAVNEVIAFSGDGGKAEDWAETFEARKHGCGPFLSGGLATAS